MEGASFKKPLCLKTGGFKIPMAVGGKGVDFVTHPRVWGKRGEGEKERNQRREGNQKREEKGVAGMIVTYPLNYRVSPAPLPDVVSRMLQRTTFYHWYGPNSFRTNQGFHQASRGPPTPLRRRQRNQMGF